MLWACLNLAMSLDYFLGLASFSLFSVLVGIQKPSSSIFQRVFWSGSIFLSNFSFEWKKVKKFKLRNRSFWKLWRRLSALVLYLKIQKRCILIGWEVNWLQRARPITVCYWFAAHDVVKMEHWDSEQNNESLRSAVKHTFLLDKAIIQGQSRSKDLFQVLKYTRKTPSAWRVNCGHRWTN